jgi:ABC transport system ATP-binding/permease protein
VADTKRILSEGGDAQQIAYNLEIIRNEMAKEQRKVPGFVCNGLDQLTPESVSLALMDEVKVSIDELEDYYIKNYNQVNQQRELRMAELTQTPELKEAYFKLQDASFNESLEDFVTNKNDLKKIVEYDGQLVQKQNLIFSAPVDQGFFGAHFYAPSKTFFGQQITTLSANVMVIWGMSVLLTVVLFNDGMAKLLQAITQWAAWVQEKRAKKIE